MPDRTTRQLQLAAALLAAAASLPAGAQTGLKIPQNAGEMEQVLKQPAGPECARCGVVVSTMTEPSGIPRAPQRPNLAKNPGLIGGPGGQLGTAPLVGLGGEAKEYRTQDVPIPIYVIIVRYDDGRHDRIEQETDPQVRKGDRVRVTDQGVELQ
jgi:hypothetical protein